MIRIQIPSNLRQHTSGQGIVEIPGNTVGEALQRLTVEFPDLRLKVFDEEGQPRSFVNIFVNDRHIRDLQNLETPLSGDEELLLVPALAGG